jgi:hypothetical protein
VPTVHRSTVTRFAVPARTAAVVLTAGLLAASAPLLARADESDTVVGEVVQAWAEHRDPQDAAAHAADSLLTWIETPDGDAVRVSARDLVADLSDEGVRTVPVGATVEVVLGDDVVDRATTQQGLEPAREVLAADVLDPAPVDQTPVEPPVAGAATDEVTVVMMIPAGGAAEPGRTLAQVEAAVNTQVAPFWSAQTGGLVQIATAPGNDPAWIQSTVDCSNPSALWSQAATAAGWSPGTGKHLLVYLPRNSAGCAYGLAQVGSSLTAGGRLYVTDVAMSVIAHELGHNFGLGHSSGQQCDQGTESGSCRTEAYRDYYDVMGVSWQQVGTLNAAQAVRLGLLGGGQQQTVSASGTAATYTLSPLSGTTGVRGLKLVDPSGVVYWLEYRTAAGQDAWLGTSGNRFGLQTGVLLHRAAPFPTSAYYSDTSILLDATPSPSPSWNSDVQVALPVGTPVGVSGSNFTVTVQSTDASGATVRVAQLGGDAACAGRPSVPMSGVALLGSGTGTTALAVGSDRALWTRAIDGGQRSWQSLGGTVLFGPAAATSGATSYVFVIGTDGALYVRSDPGSVWTPWQSLGGSLSSSPAAASVTSGEVRVFARGRDGGLWSRELQGAVWGPWVAHGGYLSSPPTATADVDNGRIQVAVRGGDGYVYEQRLAVGSGAGTYSRREVLACSALVPAPVRAATDPADSVFLDSQGTPRLLSATGSRSLGGVMSSTPAVEFPSGDVVLVGAGRDHSLWLYDGRTGGNGWVGLGGYVM